MHLITTLAKTNREAALRNCHNATTQIIGASLAELFRNFKDWILAMAALPTPNLLRGQQGGHSIQFPIGQPTAFFELRGLDIVHLEDDRFDHFSVPTRLEWWQSGCCTRSQRRCDITGKYLAQ